MSLVKESQFWEDESDNVSFESIDTPNTMVLDSEEDISFIDDNEDEIIVESDDEVKDETEDEAEDEVKDETEDETENEAEDEINLSEGLEALDDLDIDGVVIQVEDEVPTILDFTLPKFPGSDNQDDDEFEISVEEDKDNIEVAEKDMWDWESNGLGQFLSWLHSMFGSIPKYKGHETSGVERAISYLSRLDTSISKAVRSDLKEELDISQIENARKEIREGIKRLNERLDRLTVGQKKKKANNSSEYQDLMVKEAQKITGVNKTTITVDILLARIAKVCINGMVSGGHDIEDMFDRQIKKYNLDIREQASVMQLLEDMGYPIRRDRGFLRDEEIDVSKSDNFDWSAQYYS